MNDELYSNYVDREPHPRNARFIRSWHAHQLANAISVCGMPRSVLEIGPGHGYFAEACREMGIEYRYCDTSPAVHRKMSELGFTGDLGLLHEIPGDRTGVDIIWMSLSLIHI